VPRCWPGSLRIRSSRLGTRWRTFYRRLGHGLRVHVVAPLEERVKQIAGEEKLDLVAAQKRALHHDREVRARVQSLASVDIEDATIYDLVVNTVGHPRESLAASVIELTHKIENLACNEHRQKLCDTAIAQQVRAALMAHPKSAKRQSR